MRTPAYFVGLLGLCAAQAFSQNPPAPAAAGKEPAAIEGRVVNALTGEPIRRVNLSLMPVSSGGTGAAPAQPASAVTDAEGKFQFQSLEAGRYTLWAEKTGFVRQQYGASSGQFAPGAPLTLSAGQTMKNLEFKLTPQGVIAGKVLDEEGEPLSRAMVQVMRRTAYSSRPMGMMSEQTNDVGEFRIGNLTAGKYILKVDYRRGMFGPAAPPPASADDQGAEDYIPTFYPSTADLEAALPISVGPGQEVSGIEIRLQKARVYRVRGKLVGAAADGSSRVQVSLQPQRRPGGSMVVFSFGGGGSVKPDGSFEIPSVQPGSYYATAMRVGFGRPETLGRAPVTVTNANVDGVVITAGTSITVTGTVQMEGDDRTRITGNVYLQPAEGIGFGVQPARIQEDGSFKLESVSRDKYYVMVMGLPEGAYVKRVQAGSVDALENGLDLSQAEAAPPIQILISSKAATIEGVVRSEDRPWPGAAVTLLPESAQPERLRWLQKTSGTDQNGAFSLKGVAPGEYRLYAWQEFVPLFELDPEQLKSYESGSVKVKVGEGARERVELKLIRPPQP